VASIMDSPSPRTIFRREALEHYWSDRRTRSTPTATPSSRRLWLAFAIVCSVAAAAISVPVTMRSAGPVVQTSLDTGTPIAVALITRPATRPRAGAAATIVCSDGIPVAGWLESDGEDAGTRMSVDVRTTGALPNAGCRAFVDTERPSIARWLYVEVRSALPW
jgi:hypothetical protein